jgi:ribosomal protein S11
MSVPVRVAAKTVWGVSGRGAGVLSSLSEKLYSRTLQDSLPTHSISIHAGKNNTILHLASTSQPTVLVTSGGTCGLKKAARGTTDAGFQAAQVMVTRIRERGIHMEVFLCELM